MKIDIQKITSLEPGKIYVIEIPKNHDGILAMDQIKRASDKLGIKFLVILRGSATFKEVPEGMDLLKRIEALEEHFKPKKEWPGEYYNIYKDKTCSAPGTTTQEIEQLKEALKPVTMPKDKGKFDEAFPDKGKLRDLPQGPTKYFKKKQRKHR